MSFGFPARGRTALLLLATMLGSCGHQPGHDEPLRIGINAWPGYEFLYLAQEKGYFRDAGVSVKLVEFSSLGDARRSFERGQLDGLACTLVELVQAAHASDRQPQVVLVADYSEGADVILVDAETATAGSLRGRRIGVEVASLGIYMLSRALEAQQLALADVEVVASDQLSMAAEFARGELDAVVTYPPTALRLQRDTGARPIFSSTQIPKEVIDVLAIDRAAIAADPKVVDHIIKAFYRAVAFWQQHPDEANALMGRREGLTAAEFAQSLGDGIALVAEAEQAPFFGAEGQLRRLLPRVETVMRESGQIPWPPTSKSLVHDAPWVRP